MRLGAAAPRVLRCTPMRPTNLDERGQSAATDPRVTFAAERTLLAWVRTGLALMGFGFVVARFSLFLRELAAVRPDPAPREDASVWIGAGIVRLGAAINVLAAVRHVRLLRALGAGGPYRPAVWSLGILTTLALAALGAALTAYLLLHSAP